MRYHASFLKRLAVNLRLIAYRYDQIYPYQCALAWVMGWYPKSTIQFLAGCPFSLITIICVSNVDNGRSRTSLDDLSAFHEGSTEDRVCCYRTVIAARLGNLCPLGIITRTICMLERSSPSMLSVLDREEQENDLELAATMTRFDVPFGLVRVWRRSTIEVYF